MSAAGIIVSNDDVETWLNTDESSPTAADVTDTDIIDSVRGQGGEDSSDDDSAAGASSVAAPRVPTAAEAVAGLETALAWFETRDIDSLKLMQLQNLKAIAKRAQYEGGKKQQKLTDFFRKAN